MPFLHINCIWDALNVHFVQERGEKEEGEGVEKCWSGGEEGGGERMLQTYFRLVSLL